MSIQEEVIINDIPVDRQLILFLGPYNGIYKILNYNGTLYRCKFVLLDNGAGADIATEFRLIPVHYEDNEIINSVFGEMINKIYSSYEEIDNELDNTIELWLNKSSIILKFID
jgi:hypothetical protein